MNRACLTGAAGSLVLRRMDRRGHKRGLVRAKKHGTKSGSGTPLRRGFSFCFIRLSGCRAPRYIKILTSMINNSNNIVDQYNIYVTIYSATPYSLLDNFLPRSYPAVFCERLGTMAEGQVGNEAGDPWLADQLVSNLGLEGAIQLCRVHAWDGVLKCVIALKETDEGDASSA